MMLLQAESRPLTGEQAIVLYSLVVAFLVVGLLIERYANRQSEKYWSDWLERRNEERRH